MPRRLPTDPDGWSAPISRARKTWRVSGNCGPVAIAGELPTGWSDGFYRDGAGIHVLTRHLSQFTLLQDIAPPAAPTDFNGVVAADGLTLRWTPGPDNSGLIGDVVLFVNGVPFQNFAPNQTEVKLGPFAATDTRVFTLRETDVAGNASPETKPLAVVPTVAGLSITAAQTALLAHGFTVGSLAQGTSGADKVVGPAGVNLAELGSTIHLVVAPAGGSATPLAFSVRARTRFSWRTQRTVPALLGTSLPARVTATLLSPGKQRLFVWHLQIKAGLTRVKLTLPVQVRRPGRYTIRWVAQANGQTLVKQTPLRIVGRSRGLGKPVAVPRSALSGAAKKP